MDAALLLILVAFTVLSHRLFPAGHTGETLHIRTSGSFYEISLEDEGEHTIKGPLGRAVLVVRDGKAWLRNAPCPLKICEGMGPVSRSGEVILCLPNRIQIRVAGSGGVDAISR